MSIKSLMGARRTFRGRSSDAKKNSGSSGGSSTKPARSATPTQTSGPLKLGQSSIENMPSISGLPLAERSARPKTAGPLVVEPDNHSIDSPAGNPSITSEPLPSIEEEGPALISNVAIDSKSAEPVLADFVSPYTSAASLKMAVQDSNIVDSVSGDASQSMGHLQIKRLSSNLASSEEPPGLTGEVADAAPELRETKKTKAAWVSFADGSAVADKRPQNEIAESFGLPTRFKLLDRNRSARYANAASDFYGFSLKRSKLANVEFDAFLKNGTPRQLDAFTDYAIKEHAAENLIFLLSCDKLLDVEPGSSAQSAFARNMQRAFFLDDAPLAPNLNDSSINSMGKALDAVSSGRRPENLHETLRLARKEIIKSISLGLYKNFVTSLPK